MGKIIGIRHEDKYLMERRAALAPIHVKKLQANGLKVIVEQSDKRIFKAEEYLEAGAKIADNLKEAEIIVGVKEIPVHHFEQGKTYLFFSHVVKGQPYNMPMLKAMMDKGCNLIDYEKIENEEGKRLIFFGRFAGLAGAINSLWSLGQRLKVKGIDTPFASLKQTCKYASLNEARAAVSNAGRQIAQNGLPEVLAPLVIGITGDGNVAKGAHEILSLLPGIELSPAQLLALKPGDIPSNVIIKVVFREHDLSRPKDPSTPFELQHYYANPHLYENQFEQYIPKLSLLVNCMYWDARYPRIVTKDFLEKLYREGEPKLQVIGDITCDPDGSVECTHKGTPIDDPVFVYNPHTRGYSMGFEGHGLLVMAVDILPSELPREASLSFGDALLPYIPSIARADFSQDLENLHLPSAIRKALILHQGKLTPEYSYIEAHIKKHT
ncbi:MAG TPA: bifunctional lysine ketoglutarate reductase /saccharopine dehydrogenase family protein [Bacteroidales bacterium]|nr:bifunctional lysine ketoglutarate reductase /saccharopine dehydrogenase family protein [Bacteroidales bacterium]